MTQFEGDACVFRKLKGRHHIPGDVKDKLAQICIRRISLDAFWSRATSTVVANANAVEECLSFCQELGIEAPYRDQGPLPSHDHWGFGTAVTTVYGSLKPGNYSNTHIQFETARKFRKSNSNYIRATAAAHGEQWNLTDNDGKKFSRIGCDPCGSLWFTRFFEGCKKRMGHDWRPDQAIEPRLLKQVLAQIELAILRSADEEHRFDLVITGAFLTICYVVSLRGPEGFLLDLEGMNDLWNDEPLEHTVICLWGQVKGKTAERPHALASVNVTGSGIAVRVWIYRALTACRSQGRTTGPMMWNTKGNPYTSAKINEIFHFFLEEVFERNPKLFPATIKSKEDINNDYNIFRSMRRGSDTRAHEMGVSVNDIETVNRWKAIEKSATGVPSMAMHHRYADLALLKGPFKRYTGQM